MCNETAAKRPFDDGAVQRLAEAYAGSRSRASCSELRDTLILQLAPLVESVARKFASGTEPVEDLVGEGYVGLIQAVDGYECGRGAKFSTYATYRIAGQIKHYLRDRGKIIREPAWLQETTLRLTRAAEALQQELERRPSEAEIAERVGLTEEAVTEILAHRSTFQVLPIGTGSGEDEEDGGGVDTEKVRAAEPTTLQLPLEDRLLLEKLMGQLRDLERRAITLFYFQELSQSDIARQLGISCNYAGHLLRNGLQRLRKWIQTDELREAQRAATARVHPAPSVLDPATELYSAEYFRARLQEETARARRFHRPLSLVLLRAELPPQNGDARSSGGEPAALLRELGVALRECLRKADIPCRIGEGEFAVILPYTGDSSAAVGQRLQRLASEVLQAPVSGGSAIYPDVGTSAADLEAAARAALEQSDLTVSPGPVAGG